MASDTLPETAPADQAGAGCTRRFADHIAGYASADLSPAMVELLKQCVLDTIGVTIAASTLAPEARIVEQLVRDMGGAPESTVLGFGGRAPAMWATFANGGMGHMVDYDDTAAGGHVSIAVVPVALAMAEKLKTVNGRDFLTAIALGTDLHIRINEAISLPDWTMVEGWFATQLIGFISGAATAGRVLGCDAATIENAMGIGFNQVSGSRQMAVGAATHLRSMQAGFAGKGGVLAALLARGGMIGSKEIFEGRYGLYRTYVRCEPDFPAMLNGLGQRFPILDIHAFKVWPACGYTRPTNAALRQLIREHNLKPADIDSITIVGGTGGTKLLCEPIEQKRRPKLSIDGKYSIPFTSAVMMTKGDVRLRDYTDEGLRDPAVLAMAERISYRPSDKPVAIARGGNSSVSRPTVEVRTKDGRFLSCTPTSVPGDPKNPADRALLEEKFRDCLSFSATPIAQRNIDEAIELIWNIDQLDDVSVIAKTLYPG